MTLKMIVRTFLVAHTSYHSFITRYAFIRVIWFLHGFFSSLVIRILLYHRYLREVVTTRAHCAHCPHFQRRIKYVRCNILLVEKIDPIPANRFFVLGGRRQMLEIEKTKKLVRSSCELCNCANLKPHAVTVV